ncbi:alpha/beta fold hydrolase [Spirosoma aerolatum]|uniref:alpha/beta fold hydrolase n=1 Tax=Spirosoma aerolatum TaxID=1211326 RepID=UPI0009AD5351|nr:alpha/beta fold hydrolase [Spirosoma aerolatum]
MMKWLCVWLLLISAPLCYGQDGFIAGSTKLAFWRVGQKATTVIVLHGGPGATHQYLRPEFDALSQTAQVIYYDQRGCGKSAPASSYTWQDHLADLKRLKNTLAKNQQVFLAGSSWGSFLAILYAYTYPQDVKGVILSGTVTWTGQEEEYHRDTLLTKRVVKSQKGSIGETGLVSRQTPGGVSQQDTVSISKEIELTSGLPQYEPVMSMVSAPKAARLKQINVPILLFNGSKSVHFDGAREYLELFPHVRVQTVGDAGHDPWLRDPKVFFSICNEFIRDNTERSK